MPASLPDWSAAIVGASATVGAILGWLRWVRPRLAHFLDQVGAVRDSILGREAVVDSITGTELAPALPGVGVRLAATEQHLGTLAESVAILAQSHRRLDDHETRIIRLEEAVVERVVGKAESAAAWQAMTAVAKAIPPDAVKSDEDR